MKCPCQDRHQARQQVLQVRCLGFRMVQPEEYLGLGLAHLVIGLIQRQPRDQYQLLPCRRETARERPIQQRVEFAENLADLARRQIQPGQTPALIRHLLQELVERAQAAGGRRRDPEQRANLRGIVGTLPQQGAELPVQPVGERPDGGQQQAQVAARAGSEYGIVSHVGVGQRSHGRGQMGVRDLTSRRAALARRRFRKSRSSRRRPAA